MQLTFNEEEIDRLNCLSGSKSGILEFLGYAVQLDSGKVFDWKNNTANIGKGELEFLQTLFAHYSKAEPIERSRKLLAFADLPGGRAYEKAFLQRAVWPIARVFGDSPEKLLEHAKQLGGVPLSYGDCSVEIPALPRIPLTIILRISNEFPASASMLYDKSASNYLPTEDLAVLGELTTARLLQPFST